MRTKASASAGSRWPSIGTAGLGGLLGGLVGGFLVVGVIVVLKAAMDFVFDQSARFVVVAPLLGLALATLVLEGYGKSGGARTWRTFPRDAVRADITATSWTPRAKRSVSRGASRRFARSPSSPPSAWVERWEPRRPPRISVWLPEHASGIAARWWRRLLRPAALAGGAAGVAAVIGIPLVGAAYMLEVGWGHHARLTAERVTAALVGGLIGWGINAVLHLDLIRLVAPDEPPGSLNQAMLTALFIGATSGAIASVTGLVVYRAKKWRASPVVRLALGGGATLATTWCWQLSLPPRPRSARAVARSPGHRTLMHSR